MFDKRFIFKEGIGRILLSIALIYLISISCLGIDETDIQEYGKKYGINISKEEIRSILESEDIQSIRGREDVRSILEREDVRFYLEEGDLFSLMEDENVQSVLGEVLASDAIDLQQLGIAVSKEDLQYFLKADDVSSLLEDEGVQSLIEEVLTTADEPQLKVSVSTDDTAYMPGDTVTLWVNISNIGKDILLIKEIYVKLVADSWFGLTVHEESRGFNVPFPAGYSRSGYSKAKLPLYTPPGAYKIYAWITYEKATKESGIAALFGDTSATQEATPFDIETEPVFTEIEVEVGMIFILAVVIIVWLLLRLFTLPKIRRKPAHLEEVGGEEVIKEGLSKSMEMALILACILAISITLVWIGKTRMEKEPFSTLYIKPGSYSNYVKGNTVSFTYGVESFEGKRTKYSLEILLGDEVIDSVEFELGGKEDIQLTKIEREKVIKIPEETEFPTKVSLVLKTRDKAYTTHFWLKGRIPRT